MSKKTHEAIFTGIAHIGGIFWSNMQDLSKFCQENVGEELTITVSLSAKTSKKLKMYAYWHVAILPAAVICFTEAGYTSVDNVKADYMLRAEMARDYAIKPDGDPFIVVMDKRAMTNKRLHKLISDALWFMEEQFGHVVPSAEEWKLARETGINFKPIK